MKSAWMSVTEAAALMNVTRTRVHQWIKKGRLPSVRVGYVHMLSRGEVMKFQRHRTADWPYTGSKARASIKGGTKP